MEMTFDDIKNNKPLFEFCQKIWAYKVALECDKRYLFLVSLISSHNLINEEACIHSIKTINFILDNIDLFDLKEDLKEEIIKFLENGIKIANRDLKMFCEA